MLRAILSRDREDGFLLSPDELHHLLRVRRLRPGEEFLALALEEQKWFRCRLKGEIGPAVERLAEVPSQTESNLPITLGQGLIQRDRFEWIVQKSVELGVSRLIPVQAHRSEFRLRPDKAERLLRRWRKIAGEAVKQCGRCRVPEIAPPCSLESYLADDAAELRIYLDEKGGDSLHNLLGRCPQPAHCSVLIGPEGGWEASERITIQEAGLQAIYLGERILRSETAAIASMTLIQYAFGDLSTGPSGV